MVIFRPHRLYALAAVLVLFPIASAQMSRPVTKQSDAKHRVIDPGPYQKWLREDVRYIITDEERADFQKLTTDEQRDKFVEDFWARRNPTPGSAENPFKEEHYRRFAYTNTHFAFANTPGWKSDRGRFYIMYGKPDSVDAHSAFTPPTEVWHWLFIEGLGHNITLTFTDHCSCGRYELTMGDPDPRKPVIFDPVLP